MKTPIPGQHTSRFRPGGLPDAPRGDSFWFVREREWLVMRLPGGSLAATIGLLLVAALIIAIVTAFIGHSRGAGNPPNRQAVGELVIMLITAPFLALALATATLSIPGEGAVAFSATDVRVTSRIGPVRRHAYVPLTECKRLRILEAPAPILHQRGTIYPVDKGRLAFDTNHKTIRFAPGISDAEARDVVRFLVRSVPRFAQSHDLS